jgi:hypothetical protein
MGWLLKEDNEMMQTRFTWLGIGSILVFCEHGEVLSVSIKYGVFPDHLSKIFSG